MKPKNVFKNVICLMHHFTTDFDIAALYLQAKCPTLVRFTMSKEQEVALVQAEPVG